MLNLVFDTLPLKQSRKYIQVFLAAIYGGGEALVFQGGYHPRITKHVISVVFQEQVMYMHTSCRPFI